MFNQRIVIKARADGELDIVSRQQLPVERLLMNKPINQAAVIIPGLFSLCSEAHCLAATLLADPELQTAQGRFADNRDWVPSEIHLPEMQLKRFQGERLREALLSLVRLEQFFSDADTGYSAESRNQVSAQKKAAVSVVQKQQRILQWFGRWKEACHTVEKEVCTHSGAIEILSPSAEDLSRLYAEFWPESVWDKWLDLSVIYEFSVPDSSSLDFDAQDSSMPTTTTDFNKQGSTGLTPDWLDRFYRYQSKLVSQWPLSRWDCQQSQRWQESIHKRSEDIVANSLIKYRQIIAQQIKALQENNLPLVETDFSLQSANAKISAGQWGVDAVAQVMTARGPLLHFCRLDQNRDVQDYRILAPTERNFACHGVLSRWWQACVELEKGNSEQLQLLTLLLDACVEVSIEGEGIYA